MNNLAVILDTSNDPKIRNKQEALKYAQKSVELEPNNASYLDTLADAYFEINERDKAVEIEGRALALKPEQWRLQICLTEISGEAVQ